MYTHSSLNYREQKSNPSNAGTLLDVYVVFHDFLWNVILKEGLRAHNYCIINFTNSGQSIQICLRLYDSIYNWKQSPDYIFLGKSLIITRVVPGMTGKILRIDRLLLDFNCCVRRYFKRITAGFLHNFYSGCICKQRSPAFHPEGCWYLQIPELNRFTSIWTRKRFSLAQWWSKGVKCCAIMW